MPEQHHGTAWVADRAIDFIQTNDGRHPWLLTLGWIAPHPPFNVPDEFADLYADADLPNSHVSETPISPLAEENRMLGDLPNERYVRRMRELYYAAVSHIDHHVGRIVQCLEWAGQLDNTLILFTSDHGEMLGDHGTYQKWLPYDSCARIPFILHWPGRVSAGVRRDEFVDLNDVLPTVLGAAGIALPTDYRFPGESLLRSDGVKDRTHQYMEYSAGSRRWISLRNQRYKYNYYYGADEELFDLQCNPHETRNLLAGGSSDHEAVRADLRRRLIEYERMWGLPGYVEDGDFVRQDRFQPAGYRNRAFPIFQEKLTDPDEKAAMNSVLDEVVQAIEREPVVDLEELDLKSWQQNGSFTDSQIRQLLDDVSRQREAHLSPGGDSPADQPLPS
jgi:arylsulfatase A-like enzyme